MDSRSTTIGIIGEGKMGTNLFQYLLSFGFPLRWITSSEADHEKIRNNVQKKLQRSADAGIMSGEEFRFLKEHITISTHLSDLSSCKLILEAIPENLQLKRDILRKAASCAGSDCILATNSSSITPSELVTSGMRKEQLIGLHFFYPVALKNIVEIMFSAETSPETIGFAADFLNLIKRDYILLDEMNGFILNRIFLEFQNDAFLLVHDGRTTVAGIDGIIREYFFPFGAFDFMESVGIPTMLASVLNYTRNYPDKERYRELIETLGSLSQSRSGFYSPEFSNTPDKHPLPQKEIVGTLRISLKHAIRHFSNESGIRFRDLEPALNEYFGVDVSGLLS